MSKTFFKISFGLMAAACFLQAASAAVTAPVKQLSGHVPAVVTKLASTGRLAGTNVLHLSIGLPLRNQEGLTNLLDQINDPSNANYHHYLSPDDFTAQFGPSEQDYQAVINFAKTNGFTVTRTHGNRVLVDVDAKVSDVERSFHVKMQTYQHPQESRQFFSPDTEPSVDVQLPILSMQGINNYQLPHPMVHKIGNAGVKPALGSGPNGGYMGTDFRTAYLPGGTLNGSGQIVGLMQYDGYNFSDIQAYENTAGLTNMPLSNVLLDGFNGSAGSGNVEVCLDIEMVMSMAPALSRIVVFEAGPSGNPDDILSSMTASNQIKQLSASWGYPVDAAGEQLYKQLALQGQTFLNCSGDGDAWTIGWPVIYPACDDPYITIVGGTTLTMNGVANSYASERAWNSGYAADFGWNPDGYAGTSGGISATRTIPSWQQGINMTTNQGSTTMRNVPDIALTADNIVDVYTDTTLGGTVTNLVGGTSAATPLLAGYMALVNQQAAANGVPSAGFINPAIYAIAKSTNYLKCFHDVTRGDNTWDQSLTNYYAVAGYDLCTGIGTPNGTNLINALVATTSNYNTNSNGSTNYPVIISAPTPPWGNTLSVMNGSNPNGAWFLFVQDDAQLNVGMINNGWSVSVVTGTPVGAPADNEVYAPTNISLALNATTNIYLAVTNYGPATATNVVVTDALPGIGVYLNSVTPSNTVTRVGDLITWKLGNLGVNAGGAITLSFSGTVTGTYTNSPSITSTTIDPNPDDKFADTVFSVAQPLPPQLTAYTTANGHFVLTITNDANLTTVIQATTNLLSPTWVNIYTGTPPFTTNIDVLTNYPSRFFRAVIGGQ